ncbi:triose-phosphate isomerase [Methylobacillus flagellatus]|uniref:triose-phosphate isomerase n=1 Tax=Methylobacillus flagellatus TaxID=405 RepID=UPI0010F62EA6|nr:triose-phosphate isomerase [Methylobacillus flagellatus]
MRRKLVVGNWKMHGSLEQNQVLLTQMMADLEGLRDADCAICVPHPYLAQAQQLLKGSNIGWGGQNVSPFQSGAYTGAVSARMLADFGCTYAIIGHSERRVLIHESNVTAAASFGAALQAGLTPIFCVGETLEERQAGVTEAVVGSQLIAILNTLGLDILSKAVQLRAVIAYEPVWAIGTGKTATPDQAQAVHAFIRKRIAERDPDIARRVRILYGGSVKPSNAAQLFVMPDIDGGLIGRCSLVANEFRDICLAAAESACVASQSISD